MSKTDNAFKVTGIDMSGYMVKDTARARAFYRDVLGLEPTTEYGEAGGLEYEFADGTTFGLWDPKDMMPFRPGTGVMFAVDDFQAAVRNAKAHGATVHVEMETPVCWIASTEDSEGNNFVIHKRKTA